MEANFFRNMVAVSSAIVLAGCGASTSSKQSGSNAPVSSASPSGPAGNSSNATAGGSTQRSAPTATTTPPSQSTQNLVLRSPEEMAQILLTGFGPNLDLPPAVGGMTPVSFLASTTDFGSVGVTASSDGVATTLSNGVGLAAAVLGGYVQANLNAALAAGTVGYSDLTNSSQATLAIQAILPNIDNVTLGELTASMVTAAHATSSGQAASEACQSLAFLVEAQKVTAAALDDDGQ